MIAHREYLHVVPVFKFWATRPQICACDAGRSSLEPGDSGERLQSRLRFGFAQLLPFASRALVLEIGEVRVLRGEQPALIGFGFRPRPCELLERRRLSARPEFHGEHTSDCAVLELALSKLMERSDDA